MIHGQQDDIFRPHNTNRYNADVAYGNADYDREKKTKGHFGKGPKGWKMTDEMIREDVCETLYRSHVVDASNIEVEVVEGLVILRGSVDTENTKNEAAYCLENLTGVKGIQNNLVVDPLSTKEPDTLY